MELRIKHVRFDAPKVCRKGLPCGRSCISNKKVCRKGFNAQGAVLAEELRGKILAANGGSEAPPASGGLPSASTANVSEAVAALDTELANYNENGFQERYRRLKAFMEQSEVTTMYTSNSFDWYDQSEEQRLASLDEIAAALPPKNLAEVMDLRRIITTPFEEDGETKEEREQVFTRLADSRLGNLLPANANPQQEAIAFFGAPHSGTEGYTNKRTSFVQVSLDTNSAPFREGALSPAARMEEILNGKRGDRPFSTGSSQIGPTARAATTTLHELGHQIDYEATRRGITRIADLPARRADITRYAKTNEYERFAETFVAYMLAPDALQSNYPNLYEAMDATLAEVMP